MSWVSAVLAVTALLFAIALEIAAPHPMLLIWVISVPAYIADTMFHEVGHAIFAWSFGQPAIPSILTLYGSDQASGLTLQFGHSWIIQLLAWCVMAWGCYWLWRKDMRLWAGMAGLFSLFMVVAAFWPHNKVIVAYMGHGSSIAMGGFFLYRGLLNLKARHLIGRWLNLFFGLYFLVHNGAFAWRIGFDAMSRSDYVGRSPFGGHHDFQTMVDLWGRLSVVGIAQATVVYVLLVLLMTVVLAWYRRNDYEYGLDG